MKILISTLVFISIALAGCDSSKKITADNTITEKYWKLKTLEGQPVTMTENQEAEK